MRDLIISTGRSRNDTDWMPKRVSWEDICQQLSHCKRTAETVAEYKAMTKEKKAEAKDVGGFVGGSVAGRRVVGAVAFRSVISLDLDYAKAASIDEIREAVDGTAWCLYSTHSHTPEAPRLRLVLPLDRDVTPEEFDPIARRIAKYVGIESVDPASFRINQLMYWPSAPIDGEFIYEVGKGDPVNADAMLNTYRDWRDFTDYPRTPGETEIRETKGRMEDPTTKPGYIGAFCKLYPISTAIDKFLPDVYEPAGEGRYTYKGGTTSGGVQVFEDLFAYSYHATDPAAGREVNAFDLVRIHKFGDLDTEETDKITQLPSFKAMEDFCESIPEVKAITVMRSIKQTAEEAFGGEIQQDEKIDYAALIAKLCTMGLRTDRKNAPTSDMFNARLIMDHDPALQGLFSYDCFADRIELLRDLPWAEKTEDHQIWVDSDDAGLLLYFSEHYGMANKTAILDTLSVFIQKTSHHPVRDYLNSLKWDGEKRVDTVVIDYLGAEDNRLNRAMTRKHLIAAVARIMQPGIKYDNILTLSGPEGIGKTTLVAKLGMRWFDNSFSSADIGDKSSMEQVRSRWHIELGELVAVKNNNNEALKHFLSKEKDTFRPAYGRKTIEVPRQCVFWATTNEEHFLKGDTGNRRFWTIYVGADLVNKDVFAIRQYDIDQIWAEAKYYYDQGEELYLPSDLVAEAKIREDEANEISGDEKIGIIEAFLRKKLPDNWLDFSRKDRRDWFFDASAKVRLGDTATKRRGYICAQEVGNECFGREINKFEAKDINQMLKRIPGLEFVGNIRTTDGEYGGQRRFKINPEFWDNGGMQQ